MDLPGIIVHSFMEYSIGLKRVNYRHNGTYHSDISSVFHDRDSRLIVYTDPDHYGRIDGRLQEKRHIHYVKRPIKNRQNKDLNDKYVSLEHTEHSTFW